MITHISTEFRLLNPGLRLPVYAILFFMGFTLCSCGYSNPYVREKPAASPSKTLLITIWQNRTSELGLESVYFRLFNAWYKKSNMVQVVFDEELADLKLTGEISSINLPGLFYDNFDEALEITIRLTVSLTLLDNRNNSILWQEKGLVLYEPFLVGPGRQRIEYNKQRALLRIGDEIGELIYLRTLEIINNMP
jgi:hypothetical protein